MRHPRLKYSTRNGQGICEGAFTRAVEEEILLCVVVALVDPRAHRRVLGARKNHPRRDVAMFEAGPGVAVSVGCLSVLLKPASWCSARGSNRCLPRRFDLGRDSQPGLSSRLDKPGSGIILVASNVEGMFGHQTQTFTYTVARSYCVAGAIAFAGCSLAFVALSGWQ